MAGTLTIHSSGDGLIDGHSWIEYTPDGGTATTYGTWGNDPRGLGNGLHENLETGRTPDATRTIRIDDAGEARLMATIDQYRSAGEDGWGYLSPCSTFAADAWESATGETLGHRTGLISNPSTLKDSIEEANGGTPTGGGTLPATGRRSMDSSIQPCEASSGRGSSGSSSHTSGTVSSSFGSSSSSGDGSSNQSGSSGPSSAGNPPRSSR